MQFKVEKFPLLEVLQNLIGIIPTRTTLQVLVNFLVSVKGDELSVCATDLDIAMKTSLHVKESQEGEIAINARKFYEIVKELPEGNVIIETTNNVMQITSEKGFTCRLAGSDTSDFPHPPDVDSALDVSVPSRTIRKLVEKSSFAVSLDSTRRSLGGILWDIQDKEMIMVATDGHKLGYCSSKHSINSKGGKNVILSPKTMNLLCRLLSEKEATDLTTHIGSTYVVFNVDNSTITSKLIQGPYPNYKQVIPKGNDKVAKADKTELMSAIRRAAILSSGKTHQVKFAFKEDTLELSSVNRDFGGEAEEKVPVSYSAEPLDIGFNSGFFIEILKLTDTPRVRMSMNTPLSACLFYPENEENTELEYFFLLMPLRLLND